MALLERDELVAALTQLGELALVRGLHIELIIVGGAAMVLGFNARASTHDVDAVVIPTSHTALLRELAQQVAQARDWPADWLNDAAKGYLVGISSGPVLVSAPGIEVRAPATEQLLAMKLSAWRDDVDIDDARQLLLALGGGQTRDALWAKLRPFLVRGAELKAQYAFEDLWESLYGDA
jgi:predicted nucleotidyltransferase